MRGGEKVLDALCALCPDAHALHAAARAGRGVRRASRGRPLHTSFVQQLPRAPRWYRHYLPLFPAAVESVRPGRLRPGDLQQPLRGEIGGGAGPAPAISAIATRRCATPGISSTPTSARSGSAGPAGWPGPVAAPAGPLGRRHERPARPLCGEFSICCAPDPAATIIGRLPWSRRPSIPRSTRRRPAPPSPTYSWSPPSSPTSGSTSPSHAARTADVPLKIAGEGTDRARLEALAGPDVEFLGRATDETVRELYRGATAVLLPGRGGLRHRARSRRRRAAGPVIALGRGGALETVVDGETGRPGRQHRARRLGRGHAPGPRRRRRRPTPSIRRASAPTPSSSPASGS